MQATSRRRAIWAFGAASLISIILGAAVMAQAGVSAGLWIRNPATWLVAACFGVLIASRGWVGLPTIFAAAGIVFLSFFGPQQEGVSRWIGAGPIQLNAAALVLPLAIAAFDRERAWTAAACFIAIAILVAQQPDISQLASFLIAGVILFTWAFGHKGALASLAASALLVAFCLTQPDPLLPVPHVEGIFRLAWTQTPLLGAGMAVALAATTLAPLLLWSVGDRRWKALALFGYFAAVSLAPLLGAYPVPLAGYGPSFVIGWVLGFAALTSSPKANS